MLAATKLDVDPDIINESVVPSNDENCGNKCNVNPLAVENPAEPVIPNERIAFLSNEAKSPVPTLTLRAGIQIHLELGLNLEC